MQKTIHLLLNLNTKVNKISYCINTSKSISAFGENVLHFSPQLAGPGNYNRRKRAKKSSVRKNPVMPPKNKTKKQQQSFAADGATHEHFPEAQRLLALALSNVFGQRAAGAPSNTNKSNMKSQDASIIKTPENQPYLENLPPLSGMLYELAVQFRAEICLLQMLIDSELPQNSKTALKDQLIVAEITLANNSPITKEYFQYMRSIILSTLEKYQNLKKATPIFYSMTHNHTYINILCDDTYAFDCLKYSVGRMEALGSVCLYPLEPNAVRLYCFSAIYSGIVEDPKKFLLQVRLQWPKIRTDHWIVASSKVCTEGQCETQFLFLVDELSALALEYQYGYRLFICLEEALFHNHGQLPNFF